ncbi:hypothetical protein ACKKBG_A09065 [Auxenochlorella protothecoides x Auxenochlorella symbiontica]
MWRSARLFRIAIQYSPRTCNPHRPGKRPMASATSHRLPLDYNVIKNDERYRQLEKEWQEYARNGGTDKIIQGFQAGVVDLLNEIDLASPVSDLRSKAASPPTTEVNSSEKLLHWVDLVLAGGALLGIAHVGYIYALEHAGIRFRAIGGTSAGALAAVLLAGLRPKPDAPAGTALLESLLQMPVPKFKDGAGLDKAVGDCLIGLATGTYTSPLNWLLLPLFPVALARIVAKAGIHPGTVLEKWVHGELEEKGAGTLGALKTKCDLKDIVFEKVATESHLKSLQVPDNGQPLEGLVVAVSADVTTGSKANLSWKRDPAVNNSPVTHSELYWADPDSEKAAQCVRASVSIPVFFQPKIVPAEKGKTIPNAGELAKPLKNKWETVGFSTTIPDQVRFQDGAVLSGFPINLFHVPPTEPVRCPTFGVALSPPREKKKTSNLLELLGATIMTATHIQDIEFIAQNKEYEMLTQIVDDGNVSALDFNLPIIGKYVLFYNGVLAARDFLMGDGNGRPHFDWAKYKDHRANISAANRRGPNNGVGNGSARLAQVVGTPTQ